MALKNLPSTTTVRLPVVGSQGQIPSDLDLFAEIERLKKERNAVILAHYYQEPDIQDVADILGDSLALARQAQATDADLIVLCGVHFMAETAKILNPSKKVVVPDLDAGCSLADSCPTDKFKAFKDAHPGHVVVSYVNTTAEIKALSDWCCTSGNAVDIINAIPEDTPIIFAPDANLGRYLIAQTGRDMVLWQGSCIVHETFEERYVLKLLATHPDAELIAHPECEQTVLNHAHYIGSTKRLLEYVQTSGSETFIVATEAGILHAMQKVVPNKTLIPAAPIVGDLLSDHQDKLGSQYSTSAREGEHEQAGCGCSTCPYMKYNTLEKVYLALRDGVPEVTLSESLRKAATLPIERMVSIG